MARKPRIHCPGAFYHVILRGNAQQDIFFDDEDRYRFYLLIQEGIERFGHRVHAFICMTNHIHLVIQVGNIPLSRIMQNLSFRYTRWVNWRQHRSGHLFQGRYKAVMIEADEYLLQLVGYLHLNPVRTGMVNKPDDYPWSSQRAYIGREIIPWLTTEIVLAQFADNQATARRLFGTFVNDRINEGHREEFHRGCGSDARVLGEELFVEKMLSLSEGAPLKKPSLDTIIQAVSNLYNLQPGELAATGQGVKIAGARGMAAWATQELSDASLADLARRLGRDATTLSSSVRRLMMRSNRDERLVLEQARLKELVDEFTALQAL